MKQLTATDLLAIDFSLFVKETNETYEPIYVPYENEKTFYKYDADGYCIYTSNTGITLTFNWMATSFYVEKGERLKYRITLDCHDPELKICYQLEPIELINDDGSVMDEIEVHNTLFRLVEDTVNFEQVIEKDLPTHAAGDY